MDTISRRTVLGQATIVGTTLYLGNLARVAAQGSTPASGPITGVEIAPGVVAEVLAAAPSLRAPGQTLYVARFTFQPGAEIFPHRHPGTTVDGVVSGTWSWTLLEGTAHVVRGAASPNPQPSEAITEPGTEIVLETGDAISYEDDVVHTARGTGAEPVVVNSAQLLTEGAPRMSTDDMEMGSPPA